MIFWGPLLLLGCLGLSVGPTKAGRCFEQISHRKSFFNYNGEPQALIIDSSDGISHNITSNILKIYLEEVLGYDAVSIAIHLNRSVVASISRVSDIALVPNTMINLEVWLEPKDFVPPLTHVWNKGFLIALARYGWFATKNNMSWKDFLVTNTLFQLPPENHKQILQFAADRHRNFTRECEHCINGAYTPDHCIGQDCSVLLSGDYGTSKDVIRHINSLKLYVSVIWLDKDLSLAIDYLPRDWPLLVLTWIPNEVSVRRWQWHPVTFPFAFCTLASERPPGCVYESRRVTKIVSDWVRVGANSAFKALDYINFRRADYDYMLRNSMNPSLSHYNIACNWMKNNTKSWRRWSSDKTQKPKLSICGIVPLSGEMSELGAGIVTAIQMAVERIENDTSILPHHELTITSHDGGCASDLVMETFINYVLESNARDLIGIVGPACSETVEPLIKLTKYFRTVVISYSAEGSSFSNKEQYPYFFRTIGANRRYTDVYCEMFQRLGWKRMVALTEEGPKYAEYLSDLESIHSNKFQLIYQKKFPRERISATIRTYLEGFKTDNARIIVADIHDGAARAVMCEAFRQKMTAADGYVWFLPQWLSKDWYNTSNHIAGDTPSCTSSEMQQAIEGHFSLAHRYFAPDTDLTHENETVAEWKKVYKSRLRPNVSESKYAGFAYDAVWTYAYALHKLHSQNESYLSDIHSLNATTMFVKLINESDFLGVSGRITFNRAEPSRPTVINILQWVSQISDYVEVGFMTEDQYSISGNSSGTFNFDVNKIVWFTKDGKKPTDGSETSICVVKGLADLLGVNCTNALVIANVVGFSVLLILMGIGIAFTKTKYDKKMKKYERSHAYMRSIGLDKFPTDNLLDMEKWEIPRDCVVINRRLGEGAFGMVYGGEAFFDKKGWMAAAVKTLKVSSTTEQKLEFLGEAEMMKRFDHKNIVKLLGVCTRDEPVYTIMEFMLYGDLKTFLLNRRHLVSATRFLEENNEVSSRKLTNMALDIARGLSYLASLKYVHRDLACRNCLLNSSRVVKIADFGLTRPMYEHDYYKFSRKGMLPIRWMAPESLKDGIFTPQSDIWALGVVLFEIVTFGSYPFQGLSNNQVVEHVKAGNTIQIPKGVKTPLECLITSCWKPDPKKRPTASEMVEFLANNPRIISPCLDTPASSVAVEDSDGLGLEFNLRPSAPASPLDPAINFFPEDGITCGSRPGTPPTDDPTTDIDLSEQRLLLDGRAVHFPVSQSDENLRNESNF